ncbi:MAG: hypothetical protein A2431_00005 [Candidatus Zambryskibacteria bacterium RIFOXYC1_FULL_39_10]|uniref:Uncharacterized protein n=1 Tax=Candidatus Zambryskibacteria bacterium RIFOXYC1_FULL_39_10 TaxID=1802779 RepID=A0A1G2UYR8_9BACT|nr:MAG: hypothetical protein A2431_00005 [Candidatus Zambryskibacteria bacterium RIFOXYC1_FULL_39_10]OHB15034.1 MAG: hypothetical protein A2605_00555 [Candidatus Zambryskibacteria bacterium RIFOXYD1_FULL_39_35]
MNEETNPLKLNKYLYIDRTPTWLVRSVYCFGIFSWLLVAYGFWRAMGVDPFYEWVVAPIIGLFTAYHLMSFGINLFYRQFDKDRHIRLVKKFWKNSDEASVDIFLPICGEDLEVLNNTWEYVSQIDYQNKKVYVLDDSKEDCDKHKFMAESFGFNYIERPNKGEMKKAGNLKYTFERTNGEFIAIFDADFAPHPDFLKEMLPYASDPKVGIVQSPQYFQTSQISYKKSPLAYAAAYQEEIFYRVMQVARDHFDAAICCGSNAVYRRRAVEDIGGPRQVDASEDSRTGFALLNKGWVTRYLPVLLAAGICPDNTYAYFHQQHRWCRGRSSLVLSKEFLYSRVSIIQKICNVSGFLSFLSRPLMILLSFHLFWTLIFYSSYISFMNSLIFFPYIIFSLFLFPLIHLIKFKKEVLFVSMVQLYASAHALLGVFFGRSVAWIPTNAKHTTISAAFRQTIKAVAVYVILYLSLIALSVRGQVVYLFDYDYYVIQFWMFWNIVLSAFLLWKMYRAIEEKQQKQMVNGKISRAAFGAWQFKTAGLYTAFSVFVFWFFAFW